jgi:hypothetical protein
MPEEKDDKKQDPLGSDQDLLGLLKREKSKQDSLKSKPKVKHRQHSIFDEIFRDSLSNYHDLPDEF